RARSRSRSKTTKSTGGYARLQKSTEGGAHLRHPGDRFLHPFLDAHASPLGRRSCPAGTPGEADRAPKLALNRVALAPELGCQGRLPATFRLRHLLVERFEALAVGARGLLVEELAGVALVDAGSLIARERQHVDLLAGPREQARQELHPPRVLDVDLL